MKMRTSLLFLLAGPVLAGCSSTPKWPSIVPPDGVEQISVGRTPERGAYLLARERLNRVHPGMRRKAFFQAMQLRRPPSKEWAMSFSGGDGWLVELSRMNRVGNELIEEYSFGYHEGRKVVERNVVILKEGVVRSILEIRPAETASGEAAPAEAEFWMPGGPTFPIALLLGRLSRAEENPLIRSYLKKTHLTRRAFARAEARLAKVRVGMTAGELRHHLRGYFYRLRTGYVYFADGFLWGPKFQTITTSTGNLTLMPFGYIDKGREVERVVIKVVDGIVSEIKRRSGKKRAELQATLSKSD